MTEIQKVFINGFTQTGEVWYNIYVAAVRLDGCFFMSERFQQTENPADNPVKGAFQNLFGFGKLLADFDVLRTVFFAFAAFYAVGGSCGILPECGADDIVNKSPESAFRIAAVESGKGTGYIHILRTGHTVPASGAADSDFFVDGFYHTAEHGFILFGEVSRMGPADSRASGTPTVRGYTKRDVRQKYVLPHRAGG